MTSTTDLTPAEAAVLAALRAGTHVVFGLAELTDLRWVCLEALQSSHDDDDRARCQRLIEAIDRSRPAAAPETQP